MHGTDPLEDVRSAVSDLHARPVAEHVEARGRSLDVIVRELDELARSIPPAR